MVTSAKMVDLAMDMILISCESLVGGLCTFELFKAASDTTFVMVNTYQAFDIERGTVVEEIRLPSFGNEKFGFFGRIKIDN